MAIHLTWSHVIFHVFLCVSIVWISFSYKGYINLTVTDPPPKKLFPKESHSVVFETRTSVCEWTSIAQPLTDLLGKI